MSFELILKYFPALSEEQADRFKQLGPLYSEWNARINVISRKDIGALYTRHVLHSLGIARIQPFNPGSRILDVGTGGGFPGIPLAILFPETEFYMVDAIGKKIKVVQAVAEALELDNVTAGHTRAEKVKEQFDFVVSRAVTNMPDFVKWVNNKTSREHRHDLKNGILYLKGGDLSEELKPFPKATEYRLSDYFREDFFDTKKVVHLPL
ncbi:16S rRNA (guanine(527)-N(7))-methyltransferase RsmG [Sinomicrobium pectinilyticum]|uniref:Ribosomal RNA small subunit methyltransferase G n=1 Tax=Sinomicrobium pectinilyticum TaxID=1084421 RepID=A0A3N0EAK4_SINP1|nr:16S rRNA (guanine(527)-N(7))-methyltransferase RsmG [Sinomicrobium pectinilyticum]RNL84903.1 16S rRNA (guanine(527)-N(7))-methyltransferase RsmG [Sinomicrobium pectinilyticum]